MQTKTVLIVIGTLLVGVLLGTAVVPSAGGMMGFRSTQSRMMSGNIDRHFIEQMIPHHEGAIDMAKIALERSKRPEMLSLANGIIEAQQQEIDSMRDWYHDWFDAEVPENAHGGMMHMDGMSGDLEVLKSVSADEFDREFIEQMIPHHEMAVMMAQMLEVGTERSEMKQLADNIITSQSREITMMRSWLTTWVNQ